MVQNPTHYIILYDIPTTLRQDTNWMVPKSIKKSTPKRIYSIYLHKHQVVQNRCSQNPLKERTGWRYGGSTCTNIGKSGPTIYVKIRPNVCWCGIKMAQHAAFFGWWSLSLFILYIYIWVCVWEEKKEKFTRIMKHVFQFGSVWQRTCHDPNVSLSPLLVRSQLGRQNHITFSPVRRTLRALWLWQQPRRAQEHEANTNEIQRQGVRCPEQQTHAITIYNCIWWKLPILWMWWTKQCVGEFMVKVAWNFWKMTQRRSKSQYVYLVDDGVSH